MSSYYEQVSNILTHTPITFEELMEHFLFYKKTYVIQAIKKGIMLGTIQQHIVVGNIRLYSGHMYSKIGIL